jgi:acetoacetyl-CoA synthetase
VTVVWSPAEAEASQTTLARYTRWLAETRGLEFAGYHELWQWSVDDLDSFWRSLWEFFGVGDGSDPGPALTRAEMPFAEWFPHARVNYAEHVFRDREPGEVAIRHASELRPLTETTWLELREQSARIAAALRAQGLGPGDRVAAYLPNIPEAVAALMACASMGVIWSSCSPDFGARGVADRFAQIGPKLLLAVDGYRYGGRDFDRLPVLRALQEELPSLEATVVLGYLDPAPDLTGLSNAVAWEEFVGSAPAEQLRFEQLPFAHPLWVLYSSGTTGLPKPIVHGQGGILLEHLKKLHLHVDAREGDRIFWFTTTGWMMWNFLVGALLTRASIVLYDGSPAEPDLGALWDLAERAGVTCFGTSAPYIDGCMKARVKPTEGRDLSRLRSVGSTGAPLSPAGFRWIYDELPDDVWLFSTSGGSDVCTSFVGGVPTLPVHEGELQARSLGASVEAWDEDGTPLVGEVGELVLTKPMPSMPVCFWNDPDGVRYRESYFDVFPGVWRHGDWIELTERGTAIIYGRSDATINRGGIRMGTSEIYGAVLALDEVQDALVVDLPGADGVGYMPLFVVLREGVELDDALVRRIRTRVREDCSPRHVPDEVLRIAAVPRTRSGKALEIPVKRILMGRPAREVASFASLANPEALEWFEQLARERA